MLKRIVAPTTSPVSVADIKNDLQIDDTDQDLNISLKLAAAVAYVSGLTETVLAPATFEQRFDRWAGQDLGRRQGSYAYDREVPFGLWRFQLDTGPVRDVTAVKYLDANGVLQTVDPALWDWERSRAAADVWTLSSFQLPVLAHRPGSVRIIFAAGFNDPYSSEGDDSLNLPEQAPQAIRLLVAHWYSNREDVTVDKLGTIPHGVEDLANQIRVYG